jgi:hypothetical protein
MVSRNFARAPRIFSSNYFWFVFDFASRKSELNNEFTIELLISGTSLNTQVFVNVYL